MKTNRSLPSKGFTLIELLTVIAIIGILAGILIPVVGSARTSANKAKAKAQFTQYATALQQYRAEYGFYPNVGSLRSDGTADLGEDGTSRDFILALTGRNPETGERDNSLNRKAIPFISFSTNEFEEGSDVRLVDTFNNPNIQIAVDHDNDGQITGLPNINDIGSTIQGQVVIWVEAGGNPDYEDIYSWN